MKTILPARLFITTILLLTLSCQETNAQCPASATMVIKESRCRENGSITVNVSPAGSYTYEITSGPELAASSPSNVFTGLQAGNYVVSIYGSSGCRLDIFATVPGTYRDPGLLNATTTDIFCPGGTGSITAIEPADGRKPYTYSIINGPVTRPNQASTVFAGLPGGSYRLQAFDSCGVVRTSDFSIGYDTADFYAFAWDWEVARSNCNDLVVVTYKGFNGPTQHSMLKVWFVTPDGDTLKVNGYNNLPAKADTLAGLANKYGTWQILVFDECNRMRVREFHNNPRGGGINVVPVDAACDGTGAYVENPWGYGVAVHYRVKKCSNDSIVFDGYLNPTDWTTGTIHFDYDTCYIFEAVSECGDSLRRTSSFSMPGLGVTGCGGPSCSHIGRVEIIVRTIYSNSIGPITATIIAGPGNIGTSGTMGGGWNWMRFDDLLPGTYTLAVVDACGRKDTLTISANTPLVRTIQVTRTPNCSGGANLHIKVTSNYYNCAFYDPSSAFPAYVETTVPFYQAQNQTATAVSPTTPGVWEADYFNITAASLKLTITNVNNCSFDTTIAIALYKPPTLSNVRGYVCNASQVATISYSVNDGVAPFRYRIRPDASTTWGPWQDSAIFTGITSGTYDVNVEDGCPNGSIRSVNFTPWDKSPVTFSAPCAVIGTPLTLSVDPVLSVVSYQWILNGNVVSNSATFTIPSYAVSNNGVYKVRQVYRGGVCVDSASRMLISCSVLSINMGELEGKYVNNTAALSWQTNSEIGQANFIIERGEDGRTFNKIGEIKSKEMLHGATYNFTDYDPRNDNFYRIRYFSEEGKQQYSNIVRIAKNELVRTPVTIRPVPFKSWFVMQIKSDKRTQYNVVLYDLAGNKVAKKQVNIMQGNNTIWFDQEVENLAAGYYFIEVTGQGFSQRNKILKE